MSSKRCVNSMMKQPKVPAVLGDNRISMLATILIGFGMLPAVALGAVEIPLLIFKGRR